MTNLFSRFLVGAFALIVFAAAAPPVHDLVESQVRRADGIHIGSPAQDVVVDGNLRVTGVGTDGGTSVFSGTVATLKANVVDAGQLFVQGGGPVTHILPFTTASINFASGTIVCEDSSGTTVTGARTTDACFVGMPSTLTAGGTGLHHSYTCYVSAADTIKVRACAAGTADDPGAVTFTGFVISSAQ